MSGPCLSSSVAGRPLRPATRLSLGGPLPRQLADRPRAHPEEIACIQRPPFPAGTEVPVVLSGISTPFGELFRTSGQITHVLRTRAPLYSPLRAFSLDLHVLGTPPAFVLSQDQTLIKVLLELDPRATSSIHLTLLISRSIQLSKNRFALRNDLSLPTRAAHFTTRC